MWTSVESVLNDVRHEEGLQILTLWDLKAEECEHVAQVILSHPISCIAFAHVQRIKTREMMLIIHAMQQSTHIRKVSISHISFSRKLIQALANAIQSHPSISEMSLHSVSKAPRLAPIWDALESNKCIQVLRVNDNTSMVVPAYRTMHLQIIQMLRVNTSIRTLELTTCIRDHYYAQLVAMLMHNTTLENLKFGNIRLRRCDRNIAELYWFSENTQQLVRILRSFAVTKLFLGSYRFQGRDDFGLIQALTESQLEELHFDHLNADEIASILQGCTSLHTLHIASIPRTLAFQQIIEDNESLRYLCASNMSSISPVNWTILNIPRNHLFVKRCNASLSALLSAFTSSTEEALFLHHELFERYLRESVRHKKIASHP